MSSLRQAPCMPEETLVSIAEAARIAGVTPATIRRWEVDGMLAPRRTLGGHRRYSPSELRETLTRAASHTTP